MKQLKLMLTAIFAAFGRLFTFCAAQGGGDNFNFWRAFGAVCLSAILAIGNAAFAANATFVGGERQATHATHATDGRIDIAYKYQRRNSYRGVSKAELNRKRGPDGWTSLHEMVVIPYRRYVEELIDEGADIEIKTTTRGQTALHLVAGKDWTETADMLFKARANIEARDKEGKTPLHIAAQKGNFFMIEALINKRANIKAKDKKGRTPLHLAAQTDRSKRYPLHYGKPVEWLIKRGADVKARDNEDRTPLHLAAQANKIRAVRYLINKAKADRNAKDNQSRTALHLAINAGATYVAKRLISEFKMNGSIVNNKGRPDMTPLHHKVKFVKWFSGLSAGLSAVPGVANEKDARHLHHAAKNNAKAVKTLLALGAKTEVKDARGYTPLHWAAMHNNSEAVKLLIATGADIHAKASSGKYRKQTPLHLAARHNATDAAWHLLEAGASALLRDSKRQTPEDIAGYHHGIYSGISWLMRRAAQKERHATNKERCKTRYCPPNGIWNSPKGAPRD